MSSVTMTKIIFIIMVLFIADIARADIKTFTREYTYQASELDSKSSSRILALEQVKRLLLEELGVYLKSETEVINSVLTKDEITSITAGIVSAIVLDEKWDGSSYWLKAKIDADPSVVTQAIQAIRADTTKSKDLENARSRIIQLTKDLESVKQNLSDTPEERKRKYTTIVNKKSASDLIEQASTLYYSKDLKKDKFSYNEAILLISKAIELSPEFTEAYVLHADLSIKVNNDFDEAIKNLTNAIKTISKGKNLSYESRLYEQRAIYYWNKKDLKSAINDYYTALTIDPEGVLYHTYGFDKLDVDEIVKKFPKDYRTYLIRARYNAHFFRDEKLYDRSIVDCKKSIKIKSNNILAYYLLAEAYKGKALKNNIVIIDKVDDQSYIKIVEAATAGIKLAHDDTWKLRLYKIRAYSYLMLKNYSKAVDDYTKALLLKDNDAGILNDRALAYKGMKEYDNAIKDISLAISLPNNAINWPRLAYENRASIYEESFDYQNAIKDYTMAFEIWDKEFGEHSRKNGIVSNVAFDIFYKRAAAYFNDSQFEKAIDDYGLSIKYIGDQYSAFIHNDIANCYIKLKNYKEALTELKIAIELESKKNRYAGHNESLSEYYQNAGIVYFALKDYKEAFNSFDKALLAINDVSSLKEKIYTTKAFYYQLIGISSEALRNYRNAVKFAEVAGGIADQGTYVSLASEEIAAGNYSTGIDILNKVVRLYPQQSDSYVERGEVFFETGNYKKAFSDFDKAQSIEPTNGRVYYSRAIAYASLGDKEKAINEMKIADKFGYIGAKRWLNSNK